MDQTPAYLPYILPATAVFNILLGWAIYSLKAGFKGGLAQFQLDLLDKINGKYLHSQVADEKFGRLEDKIDELRKALAPQASETTRASARRKVARGAR